MRLPGVKISLRQYEKETLARARDVDWQGGRECGA